MSPTPAKLTWDEAKARLPIGTEVTGRVVAVQPFGVFVDLGVGYSGLLEVPDMAGNNRKQQCDYPQVGQLVTAKVIWHQDHDQQIKLSQRS